MHSISSKSPDNGVSNLLECVSTSNMYIMLGKSYPIHKALIPSVPCQSHNTIFVKIEAD